MKSFWNISLRQEKTPSLNCCNCNAQIHLFWRYMPLAWSACSLVHLATYRGHHWRFWKYGNKYFWIYLIILSIILISNEMELFALSYSYFWTFEYFHQVIVTHNTLYFTQIYFISFHHINFSLNLNLLTEVVGCIGSCVACFTKQVA